MSTHRVRWHPRRPAQSHRSHRRRLRPRRHLRTRLSATAMAPFLIGGRRACAAAQTASERVRSRQGPRFPRRFQFRLPRRPDPSRERILVDAPVRLVKCQRRACDSRRDQRTRYRWARWTLPFSGAAFLASSGASSADFDPRRFITLPNRPNREPAACSDFASPADAGRFSLSGSLSAREGRSAARGMARRRAIAGQDRS